MKIDTSTIAGFDAMSADEKVKALLEYDVQTSETDDVRRLRDAITKANKEAAEYKRRYLENADEQTKAKEAQAELENGFNQKIADLQTQNETLMRNARVSELTARYTGLGYSAELAGKAAVAMVDGDDKTMLEVQTAYREEQRKLFESEAAQRQPGLTPGSTPSSDSSVDFAKNLASQKNALNEEGKKAFETYFGK